MARRKRRSAIGTAFLDVLSCAFGAAILLAIIFSVTKNKPAAPRVGEFIFGICSAPGEGQLGLFVQAPGKDPIPVYYDGSNPQLTVPKVGTISVWEGVSYVEDKAVAKLMVQVESPIPGTWHFRPYYRDFGDSFESLGRPSGRFWTRKRKPASDEKPSGANELLAPSDTANETYAVIVD